MSPIKLISQHSAKQYLINRSMLGKPSNSIREVLRVLSCIQVDPINVIARSHELALYNRVHNFHRQDLDTLLYKKHQLFEYWLQLYSIIPIESFPLTLARRQVRESWHQQYANEHQEQLNQVRLYMEQHGPTSSFDLTHIQTSRSLFSWSNNNTNTGLLSYLWDTGELMVHHREKNRKVYDFTWRILDKKLLENVSEQASKEFFLNSFFQYLGIVRPAMLTTRVGYARSMNLKLLCQEWLQQGKITRIKIGQSATVYYVLTSEISQIEKNSQSNQTLNMLPPLDPLIIDRKLLQDVFNFSYLWEAYVPPGKRTFGYYGMPVLYNGNFVGLIEFKKDTRTQKLHIQNASLPTDKNFKSTLFHEISLLESFVFEPHTLDN